MTIDDVLQAIATSSAFGMGAGGAWFGLRYFLEWLGVRVDKREAAAQASAKAIDDGYQALIRHLQTQITEQAGRITEEAKRTDAVEAELAKCNKRDAEREAELGRLKGLLHGLGDAKQEAARIVAADRLIDKGIIEETR